MSLQFSCLCGKILQVDEEHAGQQASCPSCGRLITIPGVSELAPLTGELAPQEAEISLHQPSEIISNKGGSGETTPFPETSPEEWKDNEKQEDQKPSALPKYKLFSPGDVALATFLGGFPGGVLALAANYWNLGRYVSFWLTVMVCLVVTVPLTLVFVRRDLTLVGPVIALFSIMVLYNAARLSQGEDFENHLKIGGQKATIWRTITLSLVGLVGWLSLVFLLSYPLESFSPTSLGTRLALPTGDDIYYSKGISKTEADKLGQYLFEIQYIGQGNRATVCIALKKETVVVSFVLARNAWDNLLVRDDFRQIQKDLKQMVFQGKEVEIQLCDDKLIPQFTLKEKN